MLAAVLAKPGIGYVARLGSSTARQEGVVAGTEVRSLPFGPTRWAATRTRRWELISWYDTVNAPTGAMAGHIFAADGQTFRDMYRRIPAILASQADVVIVQRTSNSVGLDDIDIDGRNLGRPFSVAGYLALEQAVCTAIITGMGGKWPGKPVVVEELVPRRTDAPSLPPQFAAGASARNMIPQINQAGNLWCAANGIPVIKSYEIAVDPTDPDGNPFAIYRQKDKTHRSTVGGFAESFAFGAALDPLFAPKSDPDPLAPENLVTNPTMLGTGPLADNYTLTLLGTTATITSEVVVINGKRWQQFTIDRSQMPDGVQEAFRLVPALKATAGSGWLRGRARIEVEASPEWYGTPAVSSRSGAEISNIFLPTNDGGASVTDPTSTLNILPGPSQAFSGVFQSNPFRATSTAGSLHIQSPPFRKGSTPLRFRVADVELVPVPDPRPLQYNPALPLGVTIVGGASRTLSFVGDGVGVPAFTAEGSKLGTWSVSGPDATPQNADGSQPANTTNLWTIDALGRLTRAAPMTFGAPDDANLDGSDSFTITLTPFDTRDQPVSQTITVTPSYAYTGFSDSMRQATAAAIETNPNWTPMPGYTAGAIGYAGSSNFCLRTTTSSGGGVWAPQQGDTVEQQVSFRQRYVTTSAGGVAILAVDAANWFGLGGVVGNVYTMRHAVAGTVASYCTFTADQPPAQNDVTLQQIIQENGVYRVQLFQNGVRLALASGSDDVTALVTGSGPLATARRSGLICRSAAINIWMRDWNNRTAAPIVPKVSLDPLTWKAPGSASLAVTGSTGPDGAEIAGRTAGGTISLGTIIQPSGVTVEFRADGDVVRWDSALPAGSYSINVVETLDGAVKSPRTTTLNITAS